MTPDQVFTLTVSAVGIGGALAGILIGHFLTRSWQLKQWRMDKRNEEFRELLTALSKAIAAEMRIDRELADPKSEDMKYLEQCQTECYRVIHDRVFIAGDMERLNIGERWVTALGKIKDRRRALVDFVGVYEEMSEEIVKVATKGS